MMVIITLLLLTLLQLFTGMGLVNFFRISLKPGMLISLWLLSGIAVFAVVPFLLQLLYLPLTRVTVFAALFMASLLLNIRWKRNVQTLQQVIKQARFHIKLYEIPFILVITIIVFASVWRCYYYPPTPRDLTSGSEVIAEYAVREKTMINSVFSVNLETTNNQFKPPFIICLQIIYKYAGFPFGQVWLSTIFICFLVFLYHAVSRSLHRLLAWALIFCFVAIPEMYAYTFMALFDYSNAVFFFLATWFLLEYRDTRQRNYLALSGFLMGIATYIRSETLILACLLALLLVVYHIKNREKTGRLVTAGSWFLIPSLLFYLLSITIYIDHYLPAAYNIAGLLNNHLLDLKPLGQRFIAINQELIFSEQGIIYYGYFFFLFLLVLIADLIVSRKLNIVARNWLYAVLVIYLGMPLLGYLLPLLDLDNSTKRGLFKIFPLLLLYMSSCTLLTRLSGKLTKWEEKRERAIVL